MGSVKENCYANDLITKATVFHVQGMLKCCIVKAWCGGGDIQVTTGPRSARQQASQWCLFIETQTSYDTSMLRGEPQSSSAEAAALSTEPNLFQTQRQPKGDQSQNQRAIFFSAGAVSSPHSVFPPADAAAEQGREEKTA